ncbi:PD-(D/E)XK nuclease family protein [Rhodococcus hoagii]|nr:PD-(D/E)XK nuclease family protein [Prescottella equi]
MHRSVSQFNQYNKCPLSYKRDRIDREWSRPAAWLVQGSAVHTAAEAYENSNRTMSLDEMQDVFRAAYAEETAKYTEGPKGTPNFEWWFASGPYKGEADLERRFLLGLEQCERYIRWYEAHPDERIWSAESGDRGVELGFDMDLDGVRVRGFIDAVIEQDGQVIVRDNKTGNSPGDDFQLGVYGVALVDAFGIEPPKYGDYWMGRSGKPTIAYDISHWTRDRVTEAFHELEDNIQAERFDADPEPSKCRFCSVSFGCPEKL